MRSRPGVRGYRGVIAITYGFGPTLIGGRAVPVASRIGVTVPGPRATGVPSSAT